MACTLNGLLNSCGRSNVPGVRNVFIGVYGTGTTFASAAGVVTGISGATYYKYQPAPTSSMWSDNGTGSLEFLSYSHTHHVEAYFPGMTAAIRNEIYLLSQSKLSIVAETMAGDLVLLGIENGLWATQANFSSGKKVGEGFGWSFIAEGAQESSPALTVTASLFPGDANSYVFA